MESENQIKTGRNLKSQTSKDKLKIKSMLPSITNSFLPSEGYFIFSLLSLVAIIFYFLRIQNDLTFVKNNSIQISGAPFYIAFSISILSLIMLFQPFVEIPIIGGVSIIEMASKTDDDLIYILPLILLHLFTVIFTGIVAFRRIAFQGAKSENFNIIFAILVLFIDILVYVELNGRIHPTTETDNLFVNAISETFRIGSGMYILLVLSLIQIVIAILSMKFTAKAIIEPLKKSDSLNVSELRELKKLLDEGVITQEEFENRKSKLLG